LQSTASQQTKEPQMSFLAGIGDLRKTVFGWGATAGNSPAGLTIAMKKTADSHAV
jgi:hypothetical protein